MTVAVVGAGVFGVTAALELALRSHLVTLFDADAVPARRAASTDEAKAIRRVRYAGDHAGYVDLVERSADQWHAWERQTGRHVLHRTGHLSIVRDTAPGSLMDESRRWLHGRGAVEVQELAAPALRRRFPQFTVADDEAGIYDPWGGYLDSSAAVRMLVDLAVDAGVTLRERTAVSAVGERAGAATVRAAGADQGSTGWWWRPARGSGGCCRRWPGGSRSPARRRCCCRRRTRRRGRIRGCRRGAPIRTGTDGTAFRCCAAGA